MSEPHDRPWWAPNIKGFLGIYILTVCFIIIIMRMVMPLFYFENKIPDDKILDIMTGVLFTTCLAGVFAYFYGSSARTATQEAAQAQIVTKAMEAPTQAATLAAAAIAPIAAAVAAPPAAEAAAPAAAREAVADALAANPTERKPDV